VLCCSNVHSNSFRSWIRNKIYADVRSTIGPLYRILRRIFGPKRDEVTWGWTRLCNEERLWSALFTKHCLGDLVKKNETGGARGTYGGQERCKQSLGGDT
jgi:hypothetical protein